MANEAREFELEYMDGIIEVRCDGEVIAYFREWEAAERFVQQGGN